MFAIRKIAPPYRFTQRFDSHFEVRALKSRGRFEDNRRFRQRDDREGQRYPGVHIPCGLDTQSICNHLCMDTICAGGLCAFAEVHESSLITETVRWDDTDAITDIFADIINRRWLGQCALKVTPYCGHRGRGRPRERLDPAGYDPAMQFAARFDPDKKAKRRAGIPKGLREGFRHGIRIGRDYEIKK